MKSKLIALVIGSSLLLSTSMLQAGPEGKGPNVRGERKGFGRGPAQLLPPGIEEKLNLTEDQKTKIKAIEESFAKTQEEYMEAHKADFVAARTAMREARTSDDKGKTQEGRQKMRELMQGLKPQREAAMEQIKSLLSDEQKQILQESHKQAREQARERATQKRKNVE